jgi:hypothetical protein
MLIVKGVAISKYMSLLFKSSSEVIAVESAAWKRGLKLFRRIRRMEYRRAVGKHYGPTRIHRQDTAHAIGGTAKAVPPIAFSAKEYRSARRKSIVVPLRYSFVSAFTAGQKHYSVITKGQLGLLRRMRHQEHMLAVGTHYGPTRIYGPTGHAIGGTEQQALRSFAT